MSWCAHRVVLVGAGHAHVEVLRRAKARALGGASLTLVVDTPESIYSGMVPGMVAGQYRADQIVIDAAALARAAGAEVIVDPVVRIEPRISRLSMRSGRTLSYDTASLDLGCTVAGSDTPGVSGNALPVRPMRELIGKVDALVERAEQRSSDRRFRLLVVGAGAGGVELAFCFEARLRRGSAVAPEITIVDAGHDLLSGRSRALVSRTRRAAERRGIGFQGGVRVVAMDEHAVLLDDGRRLPFDAAVWVAGPSAHAFLRDSELPVDVDGFVRIGPTFQVQGYANLFAVGDCASLPGMEKAGVYAVRAGPVLCDNLRRRLCGRSLRRYAPQSDFLSLLNLGDGSAVGGRSGIAFEGKWVHWLKDRIDRKFVESYQ